MKFPTCKNTPFHLPAESSVRPRLTRPARPRARGGRFAALLLAAGLAACSFPSALAVPANPEPSVVTQPDGTKIRLRLRGDEFFSWHETEDGYTVVKDTDGFWKHARPVPGRAELRAIPGARVGQTDRAVRGLRKHDLPDTAALRASLQQRRQALLGEPSAPDPNTPPLIEPPVEQPPQPVPVQGVKTIRNIVILASCSDHWDAANNTVLSSYGRVDTNEYYNLFNEVGHTTDGASGSVRDYFYEVSYGKLTVRSVITPWVLLPHPESYYHDNQGVLAADAIEAAAAAGFDFSQGDTDGDGWVDCLDVIHSGYGEESGAGVNPPWIWSVKGGLSGGVKTKNDVKMYTYHTEPALRSNSGTGITRIGVICHETGHFFGLPDLYDYSSTIDGLGSWCLMSGGSWNGASGSMPGHFSAWCKVFLGFARTELVHSRTGFSLPSVEDHPTVGMLRDGMSNDEYFLVENRAKVGFDNSPQIYPGLLIYHVDQRNANNDLGTWPHPAVKIEEADGNDTLTEPGDAWTSTSGLAGGWRDQTGNDSANAMMYQTGSLYDRADDPASYSYNNLDTFSAAGSSMTFNVKSRKTDAPTQFALPASFTVAWAASSGAEKYEIQEGTPATLTSFFDGAEDADDLHNNWHVHGKTLRSSDGHNGGSCCYALLRNNYGNVQSLILRKPFKVTASTVISFYLLSHASSGYGYLKCELSNDSGDTWKTLGTYSGYIDPWSQRSYSTTDISAAGISSGDTCILRFVMDSEYGSGWSGFPYVSFALDDISITGTEIAGYGSWTTLDSNLTTTSVTISTKPAGVYAYRVQPYAGGAWQGYGNVGETTVRANQAPTWTSNPITGADANVAQPYAASIGSAASDEINDVLTFTKVSGPAWLSVSTDGTISGTPLVGDAGLNAFTVRVSDSAGAYADATLNITVEAPPLARWRFNELTGTTFYDAIHAYHGTAVGSLVLGEAGTPGGGADNYAVKFSGSGTAIAVPALNLNTNTVTITALLKRNGTQNTSAGIFFWRAGGTGSGFGLRFGSANQLVWVWNGSVGTTSLTVPDNQWTFVAVTFGSDNVSVYMATDSTVSSSVWAGVSATGAFSDTAHIGYDPYDSSRRFNGTMDDVTIYGKTLSASEIGALALAFAEPLPSVALTSPAAGATLTSAPINLAASVTANSHNVTAVRFYADLTFLGEDVTEPYTFDWSGMANGTYALTARAVYDGANLVSSAPVTVTVARDTTPPSVSCPPGTSAQVQPGGQAPIPNVLPNVTATDNSDPNPSLSQSPTAGTLVSAGEHTITVTATDAAGNSQTCTTTFVVSLSANTVGTAESGTQTWSGGATYPWEINDATGTKGTDPGWDWMNISGDLIIDASPSTPITIQVTSLSGTSAGTIDHFSPTNNYRWTLATVSGSISGFAANKFNIDTSQFQNFTGGGTFSLQQNGQSLDMVFTARPCALGDMTGTWNTTNGTINIILQDPYGLSTVTGLRFTNITMTATAYGAGDAVLQNLGSLTQDDPAALPEGTVKVIVVGTRTIPGQRASCNAEAFNLCGDHSVTIDPVTTLLELDAGGQTLQTFTGIPSAERFVSVQNGAPGLRKLSIVVNGQLYQLSSLSDGATAVLDVAQAMNPGEDNVVILIAEGAPGATALVTIGDSPAGDPIAASPLLSLQIERVPEGVQLSWPITQPAYQLQMRPGTASADAWTDWPETPASGDGRFLLTIPTDGASRYFRLYKP